MIALIENNRDALARLCERFHVHRLEVFGSAASGDYRAEHSDVDFFVTFGTVPARKRAECYFGLRDALEELLGTSVDLLEPEAVENPYLMAKAAETRTVVYANRGPQIPV